VDSTLERPAAVGRVAPAAPRGRGVLALFACAVALVLLLRSFVGEPVRVPTGSMAPTVRPGDSVLVDKLAYRFGAPRRDDLVVFRRPVSGELMLKRVVGVAGDRVGIEDGVLHVNGRAVAEPYVDHRRVDSVYFGPVRVPAGAVFVLGDQRSNSQDSRVFGAVRRNRILGRADLRIWPPGGIGGL
jgi:signal peptidase I